MLRRIVERFSRNRVIKRRLPARFGRQKIVVSPDSALSFWRHDLEQSFGMLFRWVDSYVTRGSVVWDIGANVGLFSFASAACAGPKGQVLAIEPDQFLVQLLRQLVKQSCRQGVPMTVPVDIPGLETFSMRVAG